MSRLQTTDGLTEEQHELVKLVREFVDEQIIPVATELEHKDEYPTDIVEGMKEMGIFGLMIPEEYGGLGESLLTYALVVEEIARGWMSVSGIINTHFIVAYLILQHGTEEQKQHYLPRMATGEVRGAFSMSEPGLGSDVAAIRTKAVREGDEWVITGQKMWLTNGGSANLVAVLVRTDLGESDSPYKNMTTFLIDKESGFGETAQGVTVPGKIEKMGYKGVDTTELIFEGHRTTDAQLLGGVPGQGLLPDDGRRRGGPGQRRRPRLRAVDAGLRAGHRLLAAARDVRQEDRRAPGHPVPPRRHGDHGRGQPPDDGQGGAAEGRRASATTSRPGWRSTSPRRTAPNVVEQSFRIHGGYGYSKEYEIERLYREAPMLLIGEGTAEIQKMIIGRRLLEDYKAK